MPDTLLRRSCLPVDKPTSRFLRIDPNANESLLDVTVPGDPDDSLALIASDNAWRFWSEMEGDCQLAADSGADLGDVAHATPLCPNRFSIVSAERNSSFDSGPDAGRMN
jgi:hypothetical protein